MLKGLAFVRDYFIGAEVFCSYFLHYYPNLPRILNRFNMIEITQGPTKLLPISPHHLHRNITVRHRHLLFHRLTDGRCIFYQTYVDFNWVLGLGLTGPNFEELGLDVAGLALASFEDGFLHFEEGFLIAL